ncbi:MAG: hypothetical protein NTW21_44795 [Verrucomicrobia bacterium]|nr:hypothetical protein [Verrucomicrobiota bacterium]
MKPTQHELATIAAALTGTATPADRVNTALAIWNAAGAALRPPTPPASGGFDDRRELAELLKELLPVKKSADRLKLWRDFLPCLVRRRMAQSNAASQAQADRVGGVCQSPEFTDCEIAKFAEETMTSHRTRGLRYAGEIADLFQEWNAAREAGNKTARAIKAAKSRHSEKYPFEPDKPAKKGRKQPTDG